MKSNEYPSTSSDSGEAHELEEMKDWKRRSAQWQADYEIKVSNCIQLQKPPIGPLDISNHQNSTSTLLHHQANSLSPRTTSDTNHQLNLFDSTDSPSLLHLRSIKAPLPTDLSIEHQKGPLSPLLPAHEPFNLGAVTPLETIDIQTSTSQNNLACHQEQTAYLEHDTIIEDFTDLEPQTKPGASHQLGFTSILPKDLIRKHGPRKRVLDLSNNSTSQVQEDNLQPQPCSSRSKKTKEVQSLQDYDKLTKKERTNQFPSVEHFANFLNKIASHHSSKPKRNRNFFSGLVICYLLDIKVRQKLSETDRMRMKRISECGARLQSQPELGSTTHILFSEKTEHFRNCLKAIGDMISDPKELQSITSLASGPDEGQDGIDVIYVLNIRWLEICLQNFQRIPEHKFRLKPRHSHHALVAPKNSSIDKSVSHSLPNPTRKRKKSKDSESSAYGESSEEIECSTPLNLSPSTPVPQPLITDAKKIPILGLQREIELAKLGEGREVKRTQKPFS